MVGRLGSLEIRGERNHYNHNRSTSVFQEDAKRQITDLQYDLLELRDAHAKLRTTNEKLRRDQERAHRERDDLRGLVRPKMINLLYLDKFRNLFVVQLFQKPIRENIS